MGKLSRSGGARAGFAGSLSLSLWDVGAELGAAAAAAAAAAAIPADKGMCASSPLAAGR